jgi:hypothetical protein
MRMRILLAVAAAMLATGVFAVNATADSPTTVSIINCVLQHGGQVTVPAGSTISFRIGWAAKTASLDSAFLKDLTLNATVDGSPIADAMSYWSTPAPTVINGNSAYLTTWLYPTGITLQSGDSLTLVWNGVLRHPITDGFGNRAPAGDFLGGDDTCIVTAS